MLSSGGEPTSMRVVGREGNDVSSSLSTAGGKLPFGDAKQTPGGSKVGGGETRGWKESPTTKTRGERTSARPLLSWLQATAIGVALLVFGGLFWHSIAGWGLERGAAATLRTRQVPALATGAGSRSRKSVLVIGAGPAGLAALRELQKVADVGQLDITCYDRQPSEGGQWTGTANYSSMYSGMWTNGDKSYTEYPTYQYSAFYENEIPSFFPREVVYDYLKGFSDTFELGRYIEHGIEVTNVTFDKENAEFVVHSASSVHGAVVPSTTRTHRFDNVVVASGSFVSPNIVTTEGFAGEQVHAKFWRGPKQYAGKNVLIVGAADSAKDIALLLHKFKANKVWMSIRRFKEVGYKEEEIDQPCITGLEVPGTCNVMRGMHLRGKITRASGRTVHFDIGPPAEDVDAIVYATGYNTQKSYSFMEYDLRLETFGGVDYWWDDLYRDVVWGELPQLSYLGTTMNIYTFAEFQMEAQLVARMAAGLVKPPSDPLYNLERTASYRRVAKLYPDWAAGFANSSVVLTEREAEFIEMEVQRQRMRSKVEGAGLSNDEEKEWKVMIDKLAAHWASNWDDYEASEAGRTSLQCPCADDVRDFFDNNGEFRDHQYAGVYAGIEMPKHHTLYAKSLDDSAACFFDKAKCRAMG